MMQSIGQMQPNLQKMDSLLGDVKRSFNREFDQFGNQVSCHYAVIQAVTAAQPGSGNGGLLGGPPGDCWKSDGIKVQEIWK